MLTLLGSLTGGGAALNYAPLHHRLIFSHPYGMRTQSKINGIRLECLVAVIGPMQSLRSTVARRDP
jgi:hypothetical protein